MAAQSRVSSRGRHLATKMPTFFHVLKDQWNPESNPQGIVNIGLAENTLMQEEMKAFINSHLSVESHALTYGDGFSGSIKLKKALCHFLNHHFRPHTTLVPSHMVVTAGASNAIECCAWSLCDPDDYVLIGRPYWTTFRTMLGNRASVNVLEIQFEGLDPFSLEAVECFKEAYKRATEEGKIVKAILLCSPNNPLGRCYPQEVLCSYMRLCNDLDIHLVSDELYALSVWENLELENPIPFKSALCFEAKNLMNPEKLHVIWGMSKDFGATGLRIGCLISQSNKQFLDACESISLFSFPSSLADNTVAELLADDSFTEHFISLNRARLSDNYRHITGLLKERGIPYSQSNAALFVWVHLGAVTRNRAATDGDILECLHREKVYVTSGLTYASEEPGWFRIVIAHPKHVLEEGFKRIVRAIA
ncbi:putative aspartate aminotransferase [Aspergillus ruber CBS 135680]|uniref:Putative aspartate aminotransferase n=1 Tax=Aspergillus ruber (strain CBS 135680) TaxID=1388766 RepID=A0A017SMS4_ASPRC|nr:putative aspartate aminotransferase [Aspergillus ruber CBS 135680]EYE98293.1 putative aspartate aminotransferase [Aspergillus ruber CBS 135680]